MRKVLIALWIGQSLGACHADSALLQPTGPDPKTSSASAAGASGTVEAPSGGMNPAPSGAQPASGPPAMTGVVPPPASAKSAGCGRAAPDGANPRALQITLPVFGGAAPPVDAVRDYQILIPADYDPDHAYSLVFLFHGNGGSEGFFMGLQNDDNAKKEGIFISASGLRPPRYGNQGPGWDEPCDGYDVPFVQAMLARAKSDYCVSETHVFATGFSWGGDFASSLGWCLGDTFRAVAPASGGEMLSGGNISQGTTRKSAFYLTYADNDAYSASNFDDVIGKYRSKHGCAATFASTTKTSPAGTCRTYDACDEPVVACLYPGIGHSIPAPSWAHDVWTFFSSFP
jgi:polyhydroxybutyrate depolymerase